MCNKTNKLTGQNCICTEEEMVTFFSSIKEDTASNCCQFNSKSMTLLLSTPALFLLLYVKTCKHWQNPFVSLSTNIKRTQITSPYQKKKKKYKREKTTNKNRNKKYHPKPTNPPTNFGEKVFQFSSLPLL